MKCMACGLELTGSLRFHPRCQEIVVRIKTEYKQKLVQVRIDFYEKMESTMGEIRDKIKSECLK